VWAAGIAAHAHTIGLILAAVCAIFGATWAYHALHRPAIHEAPQHHISRSQEGLPDDHQGGRFESDKDKAGSSPAAADPYLWSVYQRTSTRCDHSGCFTWKDKKAAARMGMSLEAYAIGGMDRGFAARLDALGRALDHAGLRWTILSGFRDDYRQSIATGFKAHVGNSMHGGSRRTGGYGHGCAADLAGVNRSDDRAIQRFIDSHPQYDIYRPMKAHDPDHVQPVGGCGHAGVHHSFHHRHHWQ
jgi:hypothetical protein